MKRTMHAVLAFLTIGAMAQAAPPTLDLLPAGAVAGPTGSTVGWGFTITNTTSGQWIEITSANLCSGTSGTSTACGDPGLGTFTDFISGYNDIIVGSSPNTTSVAQTFNSSTYQGIGSYLISAASGTTGPAQIVLTYNVYSVSPDDPNFDPDIDTVSVDNFLTASASVTVSTTQPPPGTPAPPSALLVVTGLGSAALYEIRKRRRGKRQPARA